MVAGLFMDSLSPFSKTSRLAVGVVTESSMEIPSAAILLFWITDSKSCPAASGPITPTSFTRCPSLVRFVASFKASPPGLSVILSAVYTFFLPEVGLRFLVIQSTTIWPTQMTSAWKNWSFMSPQSFLTAETIPHRLSHNRMITAYTNCLYRFR